MSQLAITKETSGTVDQVCEKVTEAIKPLGFGVLTRIDFDQKLKEKLGETIPRTVILGACNPKLAFEVYQQTTEVALLIPCNIVVREIGNGRIVVEALRPTQMFDFLSDVKKSSSILAAEESLKEAIHSI